MAEAFETMLTGGHPNSLGRTIEVVDLVLANYARFEELYCCYRSHASFAQALAGARKRHGGLNRAA